MSDTFWEHGQIRHALAERGSAKERGRAQVAVADRSTNKQDCAHLLDVLGLLTEEE